MTDVQAKVPVVSDASHHDRTFPLDIVAAVARTAKAPFQLETIRLSSPRADEVLVRLVATGMCHTDLSGRDGELPMPLPAVLGHEGAGIIEMVGASVTYVKLGDHVVLTYLSCGRAQRPLFWPIVICTLRCGPRTQRREGADRCPSRTARAAWLWYHDGRRRCMECTGRRARVVICRVRRWCRRSERGNGSESGRRHHDRLCRSCPVTPRFGT